MNESERARYIAAAPNVDIDKQTLTILANAVAAKDRSLLLGFTDYAKHIMNMFPEKIAGVIDDRYAGISFRGIPVSPVASDLPAYDQMVVCDYRKALIYKSRFYETCMTQRKPFYVADKYGAETTKVVDFIRLDPVYQAIWSRKQLAPSTMLSEAGLFFVCELLRSCLDLPGDVAEVGAWQGGSAWYIAQMLHEAKSEKQLHVFDMGEELKHDNPQAIVCHEQMVKDLAFYPHTKCYFGAATPHLKTLIGKQLSFAFLDFGYNEFILSTLYDALTPGGILLLDNYGHMLGHPDQFDALLAKRRAIAIRMYKSPVSFVIKR